MAPVAVGDVLWVNLGKSKMFGRSPLQQTSMRHPFAAVCSYPAFFTDSRVGFGSCGFGLGEQRALLVGEITLVSLGLAMVSNSSLELPRGSCL